MSIRCNRLWLPSWLVVVTVCGAFSAEPAADPAGVIIEDLRAANSARAALASEASEWSTERERLAAVHEAVVADIERLEREAAAAEKQRDVAETELTSLGTGADDLEPIRAVLAQNAAFVREQLTDLAQQLPPGAVAVPAAIGEASFDDAIRALDATERASSTVTIEVVPGELSGQKVAVKMLRVAGACAWWVGLDGADAGTVSIRDGKVALNSAEDAATRESIMLAIAIAEGRHASELMVLPLAASDRVKP
jgi:hypothetical protein